MKGRDMNEKTVVTIGSVFFGLFLFFFGLPFTLTPFMILSDGMIDPDYPFESLFMIAFTMPFLIGGLFVQFFGLSMIWRGLREDADPESIPRQKLPGLGEADGSNSEGLWNGNQESISKNNWIGPDLIETGPDVPEDWYLTYNGPAPVVEEIYDENYAVDIGNGVVPIHFYIKKWGIPEGFGKTDHEKLWSIE